MKVAVHQRCERCASEHEPGCEEFRRTLREIDKALAEGEGRAVRHAVKMPPVELSAWCPSFWRKGRD